MTALYIPKKIRVGFQTRKDTFTGKLAYVIYFDEKDKLRKETSWENWRHKSIPYIDVDNVPMDGFIFNKGVQRYGSSWFGSGRSLIRIYDSRDFEFEINIDNVVNILMHSDVSKRDITEKCVFAWGGTELILLPINSEEYQQSVEFSARQEQTVTNKELKQGCRYYVKKSKHNEIVTYIGYYKCWEYDSYGWYDNKTGKSLYGNRDKGKKHVFHDGKKFVFLTGDRLSGLVSDDVIDNYAELVDQFQGSLLYSPINSMYVDDCVDVPPFAEDQYYYSYPELFKVKGGSVIKLSACQMHSTNKHFAEHIRCYQYEQSYTIDDKGLHLIHNLQKSESHYHSYYGYNKDEYKLNPGWEHLSALKDKYQGQLVTRQQYVDHMKQYGYGQLYCSTSSNKKIKLFL